MESLMTQSLLPRIALALPASLAFLSFAHPSTALAHEAASGFKYPLECCSDQDCRQVSDAAVTERTDGYVIKATGERVKYTDPRIRDSPDGVYHWCSAQGADDTRTICLFVPPHSF
jgi:hypothetical protein